VKIHPLAVISPDAQIGEQVNIGPFCVVESDVVIGDGCHLESHVVVKSGTTLGRENHLFEGAVLGCLPQHVQRPESPGRLCIGDGNVLRENVTIHRALQPESLTQIGNNCLLMVGVHVAHDCKLGDGVIMTNNAMLGGHVTVGDRAYLGGGMAVHQFCRIGRLTMVGGLARVIQDVPPFVTLDGGTAMVVGLNRVGLRRAGMTREEIQQIKEAYQIIYRRSLPREDMLDRLQSEFQTGPATEYEPFFRAGKRGFVQERRTPPGATVRLVRDDAKSPTLTKKAG